MRVAILLACGLLAGCVSDGSSTRASPDAHDMSVFGDYGAAIASQVETDKRIAHDTLAQADDSTRPAACGSMVHPYALIGAC
jgi:outer membrane murein-binding lipoprotein Lpp